MYLQPRNPHKVYIARGVFFGLSLLVIIGFFSVVTYVQMQSSTQTAVTSE